MPRTITIKGTGRADIKPDLIIIRLSVGSTDKNYEKASDAASERVTALKAALTGAGFSEDALRTSDFGVYTSYESIRDKDGNYRQEFAGYNCVYRLTISFASEPGNLSRAISAISSSGAEPEISVSFTIKDTTSAYAEALTNAAMNARAKAETLASASGASIGTLISIDYSDRRPDLVSPTNFRMADEAMPLMAAKCTVPDITPENINVTDTVTFTWEII